MGVYRANKKEKARQKKVEALQVFAAVVIFYAIVAISGLMPLI